MGELICLIVAVILTVFITSCSTSDRVALACASTGKYESSLSGAAIECSVIKKETK